MYSIDNLKCISCNLCQIFCPSLPNSIENGVINQVTCLECGLCRDNCPVGAIKIES